MCLFTCVYLANNKKVDLNGWDSVDLNLCLNEVQKEGGMDVEACCDSIVHPDDQATCRWHLQVMCEDPCYELYEVSECLDECMCLFQKERCSNDQLYSLCKNDCMELPAADVPWCLDDCKCHLTDTCSSSSSLMAMEGLETVTGVIMVLLVCIGGLLFFAICIQPKSRMFAGVQVKQGDVDHDED